ncbi:ABC-three component system middle component 7 [Herbaspirillum sp.]|uniref:ABC-three component system middle component 7 n=1 Tax=Herbaspirillum sp. TaxID=1890675 RepID=UPI0039C8BC66
MITPNKFTTFDASVLSKLPLLLSIGVKKISIEKLFAETEKHFSGADQFLYAIDVLYVLGRIELNEVTKDITYVS